MKRRELRECKTRRRRSEVGFWVPYLVTVSCLCVCAYCVYIERHKRNSCDNMSLYGGGRLEVKHSESLTKTNAVPILFHLITGLRTKFIYL